MSNELQAVNANDQIDNEPEQTNEITNGETTLELPAVIKITKIIAWVVLIGGALGAFEIYNTMGTDPLTVIFTISSLVTSIVLWAILSLMALNSENLFYLRHDLYYKVNNGSV